MFLQVIISSVTASNPCPSVKFIDLPIEISSLLSS
jgi:hypothetical protein